MDYDDFFLDGSEQDDQNALGPVDEAKLEIVDLIAGIVEKVRDNVKYKEEAEFQANFAVLSRYVSAVIELESLEFLEEGEEEMDDLEKEDMILERIEAIMLTAKELSFADIRAFEDKENTVQVSPDVNNTDDDDLGF